MKDVCVPGVTLCPCLRQLSADWRSAPCGGADNKGVSPSTRPCASAAVKLSSRAGSNFRKSRHERQQRAVAVETLERNPLLLLLPPTPQTHLRSGPIGMRQAWKESTVCLWYLKYGDDKFNILRYFKALIFFLFWYFFIPNIMKNGFQSF